MRQRLISGSMLALTLIGGIIFDGYLSTLAPPPWRVPGTMFHVGPWLFNGLLVTLILLGFAILSTREMLHFVSLLGYRPLRGEAYAFSAGLVVAPWFWWNYSPTGEQVIAGGMVWVALAIGVCFFSQAARRGTERALINVAATIFIIVFIGGMTGYMTKLRMQVGGPAGSTALLFSLLIVKITDVGAYFIGRATGKHKLIEWLSPKKTWEGFWGGIVVATVVSLAVGTWLERIGWLVVPDGWARWPVGLLVLGPILSVVSVGGDLAVSLLKRDVAIKDSGDTIPGMGGVLDVVDSPLLAAPVAWLFWTQLVRLGG